MPARLLHRLIMIGRAALQRLCRRIMAATRPDVAPLAVGAPADLARSKPALVAEGGLLRHQLAILRRSVTHPRCRPTDRALLVLLAGRVRAWRSALLIVQPDTLLRWHRQRFRGHWRRRSRATTPARRPPRAAETVALIREMAAANRLWGAERIRGELLKIDIRVAQATVRRSLREARPARRAGQPWATFRRNHAPDIWAGNVLPATDLLFRPVYACCAIAPGSRRVVHVGVTRHPTDAWVAQQLREATPFGERPTYLLRDNDSKYGPTCSRTAASTGTTALRTAYRAPRRNASCERLLGSVRRECLDHLLVLGEAHVGRALREYVRYFNHDRPQRLAATGPCGHRGPRSVRGGRRSRASHPRRGRPSPHLCASRVTPDGLLGQDRGSGRSPVRPPPAPWRGPGRVRDGRRAFPRRARRSRAPGHTSSHPGPRWAGRLPSPNPECRRFQGG
ncbi:MAG TPA: hypothetical protein VFL91_21740 [Thermomicrobiales bacterium]|nr:hypothetical protein [Thermomicrobiales bacterium]